MSISLWKLEIINQWNSIDLSGFCDTLNISYTQNFLKPLEDSPLETSPFGGMTFEWLAHSQAPEGLIHLYPTISPRDHVTWEEWFINPDGLHHHVLRNYQHPEATDTWFGDDVDHPTQVCNNQWYYHNDSDLRPVALRQGGLQ